MIDDGGELALLDVREELTFSRAHLLHARSAPLSRLELIVPRLVPRRATRIVLLDDGDGLAERAAHILARHGYACLFVLDGGVSAWERAGFVLFSGMHEPSKAFGEVVEHQAGTPSIDATELKRRLDRGDDVIVVDSRPFDEFARISIPGATDVPGAELVLRVPELAASTTTVVVNCAGRTRSIIGAQSLINARLPNQVVALRNGTMGWTMGGFTPDRDSGRRLAPGAPSPATLTWAKAAAARIGVRCGVERIDLDTLQRWRNESDARTLYVFDVRDPREYEAGHLPDAISAPGGQLVQATDLYIGASHARIVLVDDLECRAMMTGAWLRQMGWDDVHVLVAAGHETGWPKPLVLGFADRPTDGIDAERLAALLADTAATVIDLSPSRDYQRGHIPGAWFAIRARLDRALPKIDAQGTIVLTSEDGIVAALAIDEAASLTARPVRYLGGGNAAWITSGRAVTADQPRLADEPVDAWLKPYERGSGNTAAMNEYLSWEIDLPQRIEQDGTCRFRPLVP
jgi:rhodanese-related sulfurtransferase